MKTEITDTPGWYEMHFDSPLDMLESDNPRGNRPLFNSIAETGGFRWTKCASYQEFRRIIQGGTREFMSSMMDKAATLTVPKALTKGFIKQNQRYQVMADAGDELDYDKWRRGEVDTAWRTTRKRKVETKRRQAALLYVSLGALSYEDADDMEWRGAALNKIAQTLAASGWTTEIVGGATSEGVFQSDKRKHAVTFTAKPSTMPMSPERLALQTSAAWFRYCVFNSFLCNDLGLRCNGNLGRPVDGVLPPYVLRMAKRGYRIIQIPHDVKSQAAAQAAVDQALKDVQA